MGRDRSVTDLRRHTDRSLEAPLERSTRDRIWWRDRAYRLSTSERFTLRTLGTFRVVAVEDLQQFVYGGNRPWLDGDLRSLAAQDLVERHAVSDGTSPDALVVATLSKTGRTFGARRLADPGQAFHRGVLNPKDVRHDAALYRVYHAETARLGSRDGQVRRVLLDAELKRQVYSSSNRSGMDQTARDAHQRAVANAFGLVVVDGAIQFPDLRLEYESAAGERYRVDIELATAHYTPAQLAAKAQAGFTMYAPAPEAGGIAQMLAERGFVTEVLSL